MPQAGAGRLSRRTAAASRPRPARASRRPARSSARRVGGAPDRSVRNCCPIRPARRPPAPLPWQRAPARHNPTCVTTLERRHGDTGHRRGVAARARRCCGAGPRWACTTTRRPPRAGRAALRVVATPRQRHAGADRHAGRAAAAPATRSRPAGCCAPGWPRARPRASRCWPPPRRHRAARARGARHQPLRHARPARHGRRRRRPRCPPGRATCSCTCASPRAGVVARAAARAGRDGMPLLADPECACAAPCRWTLHIEVDAAA